MGTQSNTVARLEARVQRERFARERAEGVAEGMERALRLLLTNGPTHLRKPRRTKRTTTKPRTSATPAAVPPAPKAHRAASARAAPAPVAKPTVRRTRKAAAPAPARRARTRKAASAQAAPAPKRARPRIRTPRARATPAPPPLPEVATSNLTALLYGGHAVALEAALVRVRRSRPRSHTEKQAASEVVARMRPWVVGAARRRARLALRMGVKEKELVQEGLVAVHSCCRRFTPGRAGKGRTLFPAYALQAARQAMGRLVQERRSVVPITSWGQKVRRRAQRRVASSGMPLREALVAEGASPATVAALERGVVEAVPLVAPPGEAWGMPSREAGEELREVSLAACAEAEERREQLALGTKAMAALAQLPEAQRLAVAGPLGLEGPATPVTVLARRMGLPVEEVEQLRLQGLAALRAALEEP